MLLDFKTISFMVVISSFLYAITIAFFALQANQYNGIRLYTWGAICAAIGFFAITLYSFFPNIVALRLATGNFLIAACYFYCLGIARFLDFDFSSRWIFSFLILCLAIGSYFVLFHSTSIINPLFTAICAIIFYSIACYFLWQHRHTKFSSSLYLVAFSIVFIILVFVMCCYVIITYQITAPIQEQPFNNVFLLAIFISGYLRNIGFIMMVSHRLYQDLREAALQDFLTQTHNRRSTQQLLSKEFERFQRYKNPCSLILVDIDYFKLINDNYGHETGDKVLKIVSAILKAHLRKVDTLGRWGGEEFLIILPNTDIENALKIAEKLRKKLPIIKLKTSFVLSAWG